ncbi:MAG: ABC transporter substrate-binding protein [Clostridiales bacterium]|nr:ABC transporter substrate-binding protein [Clostridiales bacterium]
MKFNSKRGWRRMLAIATAAALTVGVLSGCGSSSSTADTTSDTTTADSTTSAASDTESTGSVIEITLWHAMSGTNGEAVDYLVEQFNESQSEIHVTAEYQGTYDDSKTKFGAAVQSGDVPDILQMYEVGTQYMIDLDCYVPVQDFMDANGYDENIIEAVSNYYTYDGKMLSMPFNTSTPVLWINKDICAEAGLDVDNPPTTFAEVLEWSKVIVDGGYCEAGFAAAVYGWYFEQMIAGLGLNYGNNDNGRTSRMTEVEFDSNGALNQVLTTWKEWMDSGYCASYGTTTADTQTAFKAGQVAMILESSGCLGSFMEDCAFEVGNANFPKIEENDDGGVIIGGASMWMIDTGDEERENAAYQFLAYCSQAEQQAYWSTATGYLPVNADAVDTETFSSYAEETPLALTAVNQLLNNPVNTATQGCLTGVSSEAGYIFQDGLEDLINGKKSIEEAEADITDRINAAIEDYNANNG